MRYSPPQRQENKRWKSYSCIQIVFHEFPLRGRKVENKGKKKTRSIFCVIYELAVCFSFAANTEHWLLNMWGISHESHYLHKGFLDRGAICWLKRETWSENDMRSEVLWFSGEGLKVGLRAQSVKTYEVFK